MSSPTTIVSSGLRHLVGRFAARFAAVPNGHAEPECPAERVEPRAPAGPVAKGYVDPNHRAGVRRIAVTIDQRTFDRIAKRAKTERVSFAEATRQVIDRGLAT